MTPLEYAKYLDSKLSKLQYETIHNLLISAQNYESEESLQYALELLEEAKNKIDTRLTDLTLKRNVFARAEKSNSITTKSEE